MIAGAPLSVVCTTLDLRSTMELLTRRLRLVACTEALVRASIARDGSLAQLLGCVVPDHWPPDLAEVEPMMADALAANPDHVGWWGWYGLQQPENPMTPATLVVTGGVLRQDDVAVLGYGTLKPFEGQGFASEAAAAIVNWAAAQPGIRRVIATTFERHVGSRRVLDRAGFVLVGPSANDATAPESDRQGRGTLLEFEYRPRAFGRLPR